MRNALLWTLQTLLALLFLFAGVTKLVLPAAELAGQLHAPVLFLRFIGVCETLGALGLVLPGLLRVRRGLTPLAATGLVIVMDGAVGVTVATAPLSMALVPLVVGLLAAFVALGRRDWAEARASAPRARRVTPLHAAA